MNNQDNRLDHVVVLLFVGMLVFTAILMYEAQARPNDGQTFQVIAGLLTAFSGSFFTRIKPKGDNDGPIKTKTTVDQSAGTVVQETQAGKTETDTTKGDS
jgi:hypothetical protein